MKICAIAAIAAGLALSTAANAATVVYNSNQPLSGDQAWTGTLGLNFTANKTVKVFSLGAFDSGLDGISSTIFVGIYDLTTSNLVTSTTIGGTGAGQQFDFQAITPVTLMAGHNYQLASYGFNSQDGNYNTYGYYLPSAITFDSLGGALTATGTSYSNYGDHTLPAYNVDVGVTRYGSASFTASAVPEPAIWGMLMLGFGFVGFMLRGSRRGSQAALIV